MNQLEKPTDCYVVANKPDRVFFSLFRLRYFFLRLIFFLFFLTRFQSVFVSFKETTRFLAFLLKFFFRISENQREPSSGKGHHQKCPGDLDFLEGLKKKPNKYKSIPERIEEPFRLLIDA